MSRKRAKPGDVIHEVSYQDLLRSCGITLAYVADEIINTDNMYSKEWQIRTASAMGGLSELLHHVLTNYQDVGWGVTIKLPDDMFGVVVPNSVFEHPMTPPPSDDEGGGMNGGDDFPF